MKVPLADGGVPFVITYRKILRKPKIKRTRRFVGFIQLAKNLLAKAVEAVESNAFETMTECEDRGQSVAVHWAIGLEDPFDTRPGVEKNLVAYRMMDDIPPSGVHFEVFIPPTKRSNEMSPEEHQQSGRQTNLALDLTPEQFEILRRRQQQDEFLRETRSTDGAFRRPAAPEYGSRHVNPDYDPRSAKTIESSKVTREEDHEEPEDVGRPSRE